MLQKKPILIVATFVRNRRTLMASEGIVSGGHGGSGKKIAENQGSCVPRRVWVRSWNRNTRLSSSFCHPGAVVAVEGKGINIGK